MKIRVAILALPLIICPRAFAASVHVELAMQEGGEGVAIFRQIISSFEATHPNIKIDLEADPRIDDLLRVRFLEKNFPEITNSDFGGWNLIHHGDVASLDEALDRPIAHSTRWRDTFLPGTLDRYTEAGKTYAIPLSYYVQSIWYNRAMFAAHGWAIPRTWPDFLKLCETIKSEGIAPLAFQGRYPYYGEMLVDGAYYQLAGPAAFIAQKNLEPGSFDNANLRQALSWTQQLATRYFQNGAMGMGHTEAQLQFFLGHTAMIPCGSWLKSEMVGKIPESFELGTFNLPTVDYPKGDPTALNATGGYYTVFSHAKHPAEAIEFLRYLTSPAVAAQFCRGTDIPVAIKGVNETNLSADLSQLAAMIKTSSASYGAAPGEGFPEMGQHIDDVLLDVMTGKVTPDVAANRLETDAKAERWRAAHPDEMPVLHRWKPALLLGGLAIGLAYAGSSALRRITHRRPRFRLAVAPKGHPSDRCPSGATAKRKTITVAAGRRLSLTHAAIFVGPSALLFFCFVLLPGFKSFGWSLLHWDGLTESTFVGLRNFKFLLTQSDGFWIAMANNLFIMFVIPLFVVPLSLLLAACVSRGVLGAKIFRAAFLLPSVIGGVGATLLWMNLYDPQAGIVNASLVSLGHAFSTIGLNHIGSTLSHFDGFAWLSQDHLYTALVPMSVWGGFGFNFVLYLAAMEAVPGELYEAAELDGATAAQQFFVVTLPLIWEVLTISTVFMIVGGMKAFESIWLLTNQSPGTNVHVVGTLMLQTMFTQMHVGEATSLAVMMFAIVLVGSVVAMRAMKRDVVEM